MLGRIPVLTSAAFLNHQKTVRRNLHRRGPSKSLSSKTSTAYTITMITKAQSIQFLVASVGLNLGVGSALGAIAMPAIKNWYQKLRKPSWTPPDAVFGPVWSALYTAMGVASWMVFKQGGFAAQKKPLGLYAAQLALNFAWQPLFFKAKRLDYALVDISGVMALTAATAKAFHDVNPKAGYLMLPSVAWVAYAAALNASLLKKNPGAHKYVDTSKKSFAAAVTGPKAA